MRKIRLFYLLIASATILGACSKTNDNPPGGNPISITLNPTTANVAAGDSVTINCSITDNNNLKDVVISESTGGGSSAQLASYTISGKSYSFPYTYHVPNGLASGTKIVITFLVDDNSTNNTATTTITVGTGSAGDFNTYSAVLLGSYNDPSVGSFYASSNNTVYTVSTANQNQSLIDMVFYYGSSNQYTLAAPSDGSFGTGSGQINSLGIQNWSTRNATSFRKTSLTESDFNAINSGSAIATAYTNGTSTDTKANMLAAGNIVAFKTAPGKYGLIDVKTVNNGNASTGLGQIILRLYWGRLRYVERWP